MATQAPRAMISSQLVRQHPPVTLHLIKLCVGCDSVKDLEDWIREKLKQRRKRGPSPEHMHRTRMVPKRSEELRGAGTLYCVIRGGFMSPQPLPEMLPFLHQVGAGPAHPVPEPQLLPADPPPW